VAVALVVATVATISLVTPVSAAPHGGDLIYFKNCANINPDEGFYDYLSGYITDFSCEKVDHFAGGGVVSNDFPCTCQCKDYPNAVLDMTMVNKCVFDGDLAACSQICQKNYCPEPTMKYYFKGTGYCCLFWDYENGGCIEDYQRLRTFAANVLRIDASNGVYTYMGVVFSCPTDTTQYDPAVGCACNNGGTFDYSTGECSGSASVTCSAGTYLPANSSTCTTCPAGSYCGGGTYTPSSSDQGATACHEAFTDYGTDTQNVTGGSCSRSMSRTCYHNSGPAGATSASQCNSGSVDCGSWGSYGGWSCSCNAGYEANNAGGACKPCSDYDDVQYDTDTQNVTGGTCTRSKYRRVYYSSSAGGSCAVSSYDNWSYGGWSCSCNAGYEANNSSGSCTACSTYNHYSDWESFSENIDYGWRSGLRRHMIYYSSSAGGTCGVSSYGDWEYSDLSVACSAGYAPNNTNGTCVQESCASGYYARIVNNSNPNPNLSSIIGNTAGGNYTYDNSSKTFSVTYNNSKGTVSGRAQCSTQSSTTNTATATLPDSSGNYCYCKLDSYTPSGGSTVPAQTPWIFMRDNGSCASYCTGWCAVVFNNTYQAELRFRSAAFSAVGATQQCFINCSAGQYLAAGSESCASCPAGSYCASSGSYNYSTTTNQGITGSCAAETYSTGGATTSSCTACTNKPANSSYTSATGNTTSNCPWICNAGYEANSSSTCTACSTYNHYSDWETYTENITGGTRSIQRRYMIYYSSSAGGTCGVSSYGDWEYHTSGWLYACDAGRFYDGACSPCPSGAYCPGDNYYYSCTNAPSNASYTGSGGSTNTCPWACDAGLYWNGSSCADPGAGYYSPAADNNRYECSNKPSGSSYTTSSSSNSCGWACDANLYWDGSNCVDPGVGYYSPAYDNSRYECTNKYAYNSSYTSSSSSNSCSWVCNAGYTYNSSTGACDAIIHGNIAAIQKMLVVVRGHGLNGV